MSLRSERIASVIQKALAQPVSDLGREYNKGSLVTVTTIKVSSDLSIAKVYISVLAGKLTPLEMVDVLDNNKGQLRTIVAKKENLKNTPELRFFLDDTLDKMETIQKLIDSTKS